MPIIILYFDLIASTPRCRSRLIVVNFLDRSNVFIFTSLASRSTLTPLSHTRMFVRIVIIIINFSSRSAGASTSRMIDVILIISGWFIVHLISTYSRST